MTLAKASHVSNYDARLGKSNLQAYCNHESVLNRDVSMFHCCNMKKNWISSWNLKQRSSTNKSDICFTQFCCKFRQLHFWQIVFKLVFISHCYHVSHRAELFLKHSVIGAKYQWRNSNNLDLLYPNEMECNELGPTVSFVKFAVSMRFDRLSFQWQRKCQMSSCAEPKDIMKVNFLRH